MIKIYSMSTCPDCIYLHDQIKGNGRYQVVDLGAHVRNLKEFLRLSDSKPIFDQAKATGSVGIPCCVLEDGSLSLTAEDAGLHSRPAGMGVSCNIDGSGC